MAGRNEDDLRPMRPTNPPRRDDRKRSHRAEVRQKVRLDGREGVQGRPGAFSWKAREPQRGRAADHGSVQGVGTVNTKEIIGLATEWSLGDPEMCAEMAVALDRIIGEEREECALICDRKASEYLAGNPRKQHIHGAGLGASICADLIRSRNKA